MALGVNREHEQPLMGREWSEGEVRKGVCVEAFAAYEGDGAGARGGEAR